MSYIIINVSIVDIFMYDLNKLTIYNYSETSDQGTPLYSETSDQGTPLYSKTSDQGSPLIGGHL